MPHKHWQEYSVGRDPRPLAEYEHLRTEINKLSRSAHPPVDWALIHQLAITIFEKQGVDLQTAVCFTLARARLHGLTGFTEGCELLAGLIVTQWDNLWPPLQQQRARSDILDWFISKISNTIHQYNVTRNDKHLLYRCQHALTQISDKLHSTGIPRVPHIENLLYFTENHIRKFDEPDILIVADETAHPAGAQTPPPTVYLHTSDHLADDLPKGSLLVSQQATRLHPVRLKIRRRRNWRWFLAGGACGIILAAAVTSGLYYWQHQQQQTLALLENPFARFPATLTGDDIRRIRSQLSSQTLQQQELPVIQHWQQAIRQLQTLPADFACQYSQAAQQTLRRLYPDSQPLIATGGDWQHRKAQARTENATQRGWQAASQDTDQLIGHLLEQEQARKSVTISYLKTALYTLKDHLTRHPPVSVSLWQLEQQQAAGQPVSTVQISQLSQQLASLNLRLCLLRPDTDSGQNTASLPARLPDGAP